MNFIDKHIWDYVNEEISSSRLFELVSPHDVVAEMAMQIQWLETVKSAASRVSLMLHSNCGTTADWPLDIVARDSEAAELCAEALNALKIALSKKN